MGDIDKVLKNYFRNTIRFANLFNGVFFGGKEIIKAKDLMCASETYDEPVTDQQKEAGKRDERIRDIKMCMKNGAELRLLALENQEEINYLMPFRCMQYDTMEYGRQVNEIGIRNGQKGRFKKSDRLTPIYTLCVYYGEKPWDGPRSLKDMMDFGADRDEMSRFFADYPMRLLCLNERDNFEEFSAELEMIFNVAKNRGHLSELKKVIEKENGKWLLGIDAFEVVTTLTGQAEIWKNREKYLVKDKEEYDMCQAMRELREEGREEGRVEGRLELLIDLVKDGLISIQEAARRALMSEECFKEKMEEPREVQYWG